MVFTQNRLRFPVAPVATVLAAASLVAVSLAAKSAMAQSAPVPGPSEAVQPTSEKAAPQSSVSEEKSTDTPSAAPAADISLSAEQAKLAGKYKELERVILRMAEVMQTTDPKRAALLRQAFAKSKERNIDSQYEDLVKLLEQQQLYQAQKGQVAIEQDLNQLLQLLLSGEREKQIPSQRVEIKRFIDRINKLIREEQGLQGETEGQGDTSDLIKQQEGVAKKTGELAQDLNKFDADNNPSAPGKDVNAEDKSDKGAEKPSSKSESKSGDKQSADKDSNEKKSNGKNSGDKQSDDKKADTKKNTAKPGKDSAGGGDQNTDKDNSPSGGKSESKPGGKSDQKPTKKFDQKSDQQKSDDKKSSDQPDDKKTENKKSDSKAEPSDGKSPKGAQSKSPGQPENGKSPNSQGEPSDSDQGDADQSKNPSGEKPPSNDESPARKRIRQAEDRMRTAKRQLEEAERRGAADEQQRAVEELKQAKAELEEILRQLREEEIEHVLGKLEGRFRKMLEMQIEVYEGTIGLDRTAEDERDRDLEIEAGKLSRREADITTEADKALELLHEEGSSVAFPESVDQMREDMVQTTSRLSRANVGQITQGIEQDIVKALEEMVAALQKAQKDQRQRRGGGGAGGGGSQDQPLLDSIAELKMIRALQMRVNTRTERYSKLLEDGAEQAEAPELLEAVQRLSQREERIYRTTRDIVVGKNK
jgi:hypothetical protein